VAMRAWGRGGAARLGKIAPYTKPPPPRGGRGAGAERWRGRSASPLAAQTCWVVLTGRGPHLAKPHCELEGVGKPRVVQLCNFGRRPAGCQLRLQPFGGLGTWWGASKHGDRQVTRCLTGAQLQYRVQRPWAR
jgi:hypothetical protein